MVEDLKSTIRTETNRSGKLRIKENKWFTKPGLFKQQIDKKKKKKTVSANAAAMEEVRQSSAWVARNSSHVTVDSSGIEKVVEKIKESIPKVEWDYEGIHYFDNGPLTVQYLFVLDTLNFCFWPDKDLNYDHLAKGLKEALLNDNSAFDADRLQKYTGFRDHSVYKGHQVFFYKRAQIFASDLWGAFKGQGYGEFNDISSITMFADYIVPAVLQQLGVLKYSSTLASIIEASSEIGAGTEEEVELRACSIYAVEKMRELLSIKSGKQVLSVELDLWLWSVGVQCPSLQHHRTLSIYY
ncbi:queuosine salvage protein-like isoform X4 [Durio zibethinus]|uniref:Queuosine 5'-phosphate N-glycosylase/hydrolase n=1 Tax=Durio zibethinus TaxID=66656 RepID=A0A6P5ZFD8_DURZI|nr:queuosine salvage protein-like isoform X4 [Durio zibethinus]